MFWKVTFLCSVPVKLILEDVISVELSFHMWLAAKTVLQFKPESRMFVVNYL
jgi:hypothetical protein